MSIAEEAFRLLYPEKDFNYDVSIRYTNQFKDYNANIRLTGSHMDFRLSKKWRNVSKEIRIGLMQELMLKVFRHKKQSMYIDLYNSFVKNLHLAIPKERIDPVLKESFERVNDKYFVGQVETPNLVWGSFSKTKLGSYDYKRDEINISTVFHKLDPVYLDFVMFHELLHKQHSFKSRPGRSHYHDSEFRKKEKMFENQGFLDTQLKYELARVRGGGRLIKEQDKIKEKPILKFIEKIFG